MTRDAIRATCLKFPHVTEHLQWGDNLVYKIAGKIFAILSLGETRDSTLGFKCSPEEFAALIEMEDIIPAPYFARASWVSLRRLDALPPAEIRKHLREAFDLVLAKLPKKVRASLAESPH